MTIEQALYSLLYFPGIDEGQKKPLTDLSNHNEYDDLGVAGPNKGCRVSRHRCGNGCPFTCYVVVPRQSRLVVHHLDAEYSGKCPTAEVRTEDTDVDFPKHTE